MIFVNKHAVFTFFVVVRCPFVLTFPVEKKISKSRYVTFDISNCPLNRAVFKTWLRLLRLVIGLKDSRQFFNQWESKPKPIASCPRDFSRASSELQVIARNCDWFIALSAPVVIGRRNCFGFGFSSHLKTALNLHLLLSQAISLIQNVLFYGHQSLVWKRRIGKEIYKTLKRDNKLK